MKFVINKSESLAAALEHALTKVLGVPADAVTVSETEPTSAVAADDQTYRGIMAVVRVARASELGTDTAKKAFLSGTNEEEVVLINQWVSVAAVIAAETTANVGVAVTASIAEVERILETHHLYGAFVAGTKQATIADVLLYGAIHGGRSEENTKALPPAIFDWSAHVQADANVEPVKSAFVAKGKSGKKEGAEPSVNVKPSEEEIIRRREEKEKAKKAKEAAKAAAAAGAAPEGDEKPAKKEKAPKAKAESTKNPPKKELDFSSLDVRVGQFSNVRKHPSADRLYVEDMNLGEETRTIVSGLVDYFKDPKDLEGKQILVMCNMKPKPLLGVTSHGMILCASNEEGLALVSPPDGAKPGDRIVFGEKYAEPGVAPDVLTSNKMSDLLSHLHTNAEGVLCWKETPAHHANGIVCCPTKKNCIVK